MLRYRTLFHLVATNFHKEPAGDGDSAPTGISPEVEMLIVQKSYLQPGEVASGAAGRGRSRGSRAGRVRRPPAAALEGARGEGAGGRGRRVGGRRGPARRPAVEAGAGGRGGRQRRRRCRARAGRAGGGRGADLVCSKQPARGVGTGVNPLNFRRSDSNRRKLRPNFGICSNFRRLIEKPPKIINFRQLWL